MGIVRQQERGAVRVHPERGAACLYFRLDVGSNKGELPGPGGAIARLSK